MRLINDFTPAAKKQVGPKKIIVSTAVKVPPV
jgi:hypothetical protein